MSHKTVMTKKCQIWSKDCCHHWILRQKITSLQDFIIERIPEFIALTVGSAFASFNAFFNLCIFFKASLRLDMYHCMGY